MSIKAEQLLAEIEFLLRNVPNFQSAEETLESISWVGQAASVLQLWDSSLFMLKQVTSYLQEINHGTVAPYTRGYRGLITLLNQARHSLRVTTNQSSIAIGESKIFEYFDEIRKIIETAQNDLLFVDPYLDAEFASRYLPHIKAGVSIRLLAREKISTLKPAVELISKQNKLTVEIRSGSKFHDRYVFVDKKTCYQSGSSFKDGAVKAPTTLTQILDAFPAVSATYEQSWIDGTPILKYHAH